MLGAFVLGDNVSTGEIKHRVSVELSVERASWHARFYTASPKKQDTKLLAVTSLTIIRFSKFFTNRLGSKFATNCCLNIPPRVKHVATLGLHCEI